MSNVSEELVEKAARAIDQNYNPDKYPILSAMNRDYALAVLEAVADALRAEAWDKGYAQSELQWKHVYAGHPVAEGEMCDECCQTNPYRRADA